MSEDRFSSDVQRQLAEIEPNISMTGARVYPCWVRRKDGSTYDTVRVMDRESYLRLKKFPHPRIQEQAIPQADNWFSASEVEELRESPKRLPAAISNQLSAAGESSMSGYVFTILFSWFRRKQYFAGDVNFINYPPFMGPKSIRAVRPHEGRPDGRNWSEIPMMDCVFDADPKLIP